MAEQLEIGVIPYIQKNNSFRFVIVSSRRHPKKWIFPKGQPEDDKKGREIAVNEAFEEAGLIGTIQGKSIKILVEKKDDTITYKFYPFRVSKMCRKWPEKKIRSRMTVNVEAASKLLFKHPYRDALKIFLSSN